MCSVCGQLFRLRNRAILHMNRAHSSFTDKIFLRGTHDSCPWCNQKFLPKDLQDRFPFVRHHIVECQRNPRIMSIMRNPGYILSGLYKCDMCPAQFSNGRNLKLHKFRKHTQQVDQPTVQLNADESTTTVFDSDETEDGFENYELEEKDIDSLLEETIDPNDLYSTLAESEGMNLKFNAYQRRLKFKLNGMAKKLCSEGYQMEVLETVLKDIVEDLENAELDDLIYVAIDDPRVLDFPIARRFNTLYNFSIQGIMEEIRRLLQSKEKLGCLGPLSIDIKHIKANIAGSGIKPQKSTFRNKQVKTMMEWMGRKLGIMDPYKFMVKDLELSQSCFTLCLAMAIKCSDENTNEIVFSKRWWFRKEELPLSIKSLAQRLYAQAGLQENTMVQDVHFNRFQWVLHRYYQAQLIVYEITGPSNKQLRMIYQGKPNRKPFQRIYLLYYAGHFWLINRLKLIAGRGRRLCSKCGYLSIRSPDGKRHLCQQKCLLCDDQRCFKSTKLQNRGKVFLSVYCDDCNRFFRSEHCLDMHRKNDICNIYARCHTCLRVVKRERLEDPEDHDCGWKKCRQCNEWYSIFAQHHCFISTPKTELVEPETQKYFALDFETTVDMYGIHTPNFVTIFQMCSECIMNFDAETPVGCCGKRKTEYFAMDCVRRTVNFLFFDPEKQGAIVLAHYSSKFDTHFILKELTNRGIPPQVICRGNQIIQLKSQNDVKLKDSYLFFHVALSKLPKMFSLKTVKGFFPHSFNVPNNYDYSGPIPNMKYFDIDTMKPDRRSEFMEWYRSNSEYEWNFRKELSKYGWADTLLLAQACAVFRNDMKNMTGICPFFSSMTIAQYSTIVMRKNFMDFDKYPILKIGDTETLAFQKEKASQLAVKYLAWESQNRNVKIVTAGNANREVRIGGWKVDGKFGNTIWEVNGCFW